MFADGNKDINNFFDAAGIKKLGLVDQGLYVNKLSVNAWVPKLFLARPCCDIVQSMT